MTSPDPLDRFVSAQAKVIDSVRAELRAGRKETHWMWFIFPQITGLGTSDWARLYAIRDVAEARAYLAHPELGPRLEECARLALEAPAASARELMGSPDDLKLRSCATLFAAVSEAGSVYHQLLERYFGGEPDARTVERLER